jgi:hypothetical protein
VCWLAKREWHASEFGATFVMDKLNEAKNYLWEKRWELLE